MNILRPFFAILQGIRLCLFQSNVRRLAKWPWLIGTLCYAVTVYGSFSLHPWLMDSLGFVPVGFLGTAKYWLVWAGVTVGLVVGGIFLSLSLIMISTSAFQTSIAQATLEAHGVKLNTPELGILSEVSRTVFVEALKLFWLLPLMLFVFISSFIPFLAPVAIVFAAWLLAYQFVDVVLDIFHLNASERFRFARENFIPLACFGAVLAVLWTIPFFGIFLAPAATSGAAWFLSEPEFLNKIRNLAHARSAERAV